MTNAQIITLLTKGFFDSLWILSGSTFFGTLFGFPLGIILTLTRKDGLYPQTAVFLVLNRFVNLFRSIPFYILVVALMPLSRFVVGTSIGIKATIFALSVGAIPFVARLTENTLHEVDGDVVDAVITMGATKLQVVKMLLKETLPSLLSGLSVTMIMLIGYSAMAGLMGGGGLGDIAIRYGYYRFNYQVMYYCLILLIILVEVIQTSSSFIVKRLDKRAR